MTSLPKSAGGKKLGLVIDLDICVGCHACAVICKEWNSGGEPAPLTDFDPYGADASGVWLNRVHTFEAGDGASGRTVQFPRSCLLCEDAACVTVCPTGASYKREEDGIVLVNPDTCIGCKLCSWACPYGAREYDHDDGVMKKCTLCVDRIYNENLEEIDRVPACVSTCPVGARHFGDWGDAGSAVSRLVRERAGVDLMPEMGYRPVNKYLPPRPPHGPHPPRAAAATELQEPDGNGELAVGFLAWVDRVLADCWAVHPAPSVILFTTASGAGYGLLAWLGGAGAFGGLPADRRFGGVAMVIGLGLVSAGLLASTFHLGHPERAWRALSQWRSSWLSREGVAAMATYVPALIFGFGWVVLGRIWTVAGLVMAALCVACVICTGMIYQSLKPIRHWHNGWVTPIYLAFAAATGAAWLALLLRLFDAGMPWSAWLAAVALATAWALKIGYWRQSLRSPASPESATGLDGIGIVRLFEAPHTQENYLTHEMGFVIGRRHARKLRRLALAAGGVAIVLLGLAAIVSGIGAAAAAGLAVGLAMASVVIERWLFFAEAKHTVMLYYGADAA